MKLMPKADVKKANNSPHIKKLFKINVGLLYSTAILMIATIYTRNEILAFLCCLFALIYAGFNIFIVFDRKAYLRTESQSMQKQK
jgi:hypothetical protein